MFLVYDFSYFSIFPLLGHCSSVMQPAKGHLASLDLYRFQISYTIYQSMCSWFRYAKWVYVYVNLLLLHLTKFLMRMTVVLLNIMSNTISKLLYISSFSLLIKCSNRRLYLSLPSFHSTLYQLIN